MHTINRIKYDIKKFYRYSIYAAKSDLKSEVATSFLSWFWWILDPLLFMIVYSFVSIIVFGKSEKYFAAFVFIGLTTWNFFNRTVLSSVKIVKNNGGIVSKVYLPKYILILTNIIINGFKMFISFIFVAGVIWLYNVPLNFNMLFFIPILLTLFSVSFSLSTIVLHFGVFIEDLHNILNIFFKLMFYLSGIFYSIDNRVPAPYGSILLNLNPAAYIIHEFRNVLLYNKKPNLILLLFWFFLSVITLYIGINVIYKNENSYIKVI